MTVQRPATVRDHAWRTLYRLAYPAARAWWALRRPRHRGALVCCWVDGRVLLVRLSYVSAWSLPGGGARPGEAPEAAARRELHEELGLHPGPLRPAAVLTGTWDGRWDEVHVFEAAFDRLPALRLDNREVVEARLFRVDELPGVRLTGPVAAYLAVSDSIGR